MPTFLTRALEGPVAIFGRLVPFPQQGWPAPGVSFFLSPLNQMYCEMNTNSCVNINRRLQSFQYLESRPFWELITQETNLDAFKLNSNQPSQFPLPFNCQFKMCAAIMFFLAKNSFSTVTWCKQWAKACPCCRRQSSPRCHQSSQAHPLPSQSSPISKSQSFNKGNMVSRNQDPTCVFEVPPAQEWHSMYARAPRQPGEKRIF